MGAVMAETTRSLMDYAPPPVSGTAAEIRTQAARRPKQSMSLMDFMSDLDLANILSGTGIPERFAAANKVLNPLAAIPRAQAASQEIFAPDRSIMQRIASTGNMLGEVGGVVVPMAASTRIGAPAATALMEGLLGGSPATQAASDAARRFLANESGSVPLPFSAVDDPAQARGAQIIDMLTSGRAGEITDQMLDMGDPVLNANLNQYLYRNYDLPMDEASRMERAEGMSLTGNVLHGTPYSDISNLRPSDFGAVGRGVYVATNPKVASDYARGYGLMTPEKTFEYAGERFTEGGNVMPLRTTDNLQPFADWTDARMSDLKRQGLYGSSYRADDAASQAAEDAGFYGVKARQGNAVIFDPANIRSRFARFDPRLAHLRNLSAGIAPFGLLALQPNEEQY